MRYAVISDIHANIEALTVVLDAIDDAGVDLIVCLGDVVGYNANPNECVEIMRDRQIPTICGNHDAVACGISDPWGFNPIALAAGLWTRENLKPANAAWLRSLPDSLRFNHFLAVHGSPTNRDTYMFGWEDVLPHLDYLRQQNCSLCFFGHTHCPGVFSADGMIPLEKDAKFALEKGREYFINPGSVGQPRDGDSRAAFGLIDVDHMEYEARRVTYPVNQAAERVLALGLPHFLAERLYLGR